jgi:hypothetical protein
MAQASGGFGLGACWTPHVTQIHGIARSAIESSLRIVCSSVAA